MQTDSKTFRMQKSQRTKTQKQYSFIDDLKNDIEGSQEDLP